MFQQWFSWQIREFSTKKDAICAFCHVRASQSIHESRHLWIFFKKTSKTYFDILSAWCSYMAGIYGSCNHVLLTYIN